MCERVGHHPGVPDRGPEGAVDQDVVLNNNIMAHDIWKDDITLFLKGCRSCWSYKVLKFAVVADITKFDPDKAYFSQHVLDAICTFSFDER